MDARTDCEIYRRFGVELEVNTSNGVVRRPNSGEIPRGSDKVAQIVSKAAGRRVTIQGWDHIHNNSNWIIKPDNSCGIEINTPVLKGWRGLETLLRVIEALNKSGIQADQRCSLHVHVNIADLSLRQMAAVIAYYIKCEAIFFDSVPSHRKNNRYCQPLGMTDLFSHDFIMEPEDLISRISGVKYYSINAYHFMQGGGFSSDNHRKQTLEFRIIENIACIDPLTAKNWIRFVLHFVEMTKDKPLPSRYREGDQWSSLLWLNPKDMFSLLKFDRELSDGLTQVKNWFVKRLLENGYNSGLPGVWSNEGRMIAREELIAMVPPKDSEETMEELVFGKKYIL